MNERTVVITQSDNAYTVENNGISKFALIGILECIVFEMKNAEQTRANDAPGVASRVPNIKESESTVEKQETVLEQKQTERETKKEVPQPDLRTRISNAIKAINALGGEIEETDLSNLTDEELQSELTELTDQYKRLKASKGGRK